MDERRKREKVQEVEVSLLVESAKVCRKNSSFYFGGFATSIDFKVTLNNEFKWTNALYTFYQFIDGTA